MMGCCLSTNDGEKGKTAQSEEEDVVVKEVLTTETPKPSFAFPKLPNAAHLTQDPNVADIPKPHDLLKSGEGSPPPVDNTNEEEVASDMYSVSETVSASTTLTAGGAGGEEEGESQERSTVLPRSSASKFQRKRSLSTEILPHQPSRRGDRTCARSSPSPVRRRTLSSRREISQEAASAAAVTAQAQAQAKTRSQQHDNGRLREQHRQQSQQQLLQQKSKRDRSGNVRRSVSPAAKRAVGGDSHRHHQHHDGTTSAASMCRSRAVKSSSLRNGRREESHNRALSSAGEVQCRREVQLPDEGPTTQRVVTEGEEEEVMKEGSLENPHVALECFIFL